MRLKKLTSALVRDARVLHRVELNVPFTKKNGKRVVADDTRLKAILPTVQFLLKNNARVVLLTWAGRPDGKRTAALTLDPVAERLSTLLHTQVIKVNDSIGARVEKTVAAMKPRDVVLLENVRFHAEEKKNDLAFARSFRKLADVWVMDAFGQAHRSSASVSTAQRYFPKRAAGFLLQKEVAELTRARTHPQHPYAVLIGGAKVETKLPVMSALLPKADALMVGGVLANTLLKAAGLQIGRSAVDDDTMKQLKAFTLTDRRVHLPLDVIVEDAKGRRHTRAAGAVEPRERILDIGPDTVALYSRIISTSRMVLWNGPLGYFENPLYARGTVAIARALGRSRAQAIIGGGETIEAVRMARAEQHMHFISTGGGAMLEFLSGKMLPGIKPLLV